MKAKMYSYKIFLLLFIIFCIKLYTFEKIRLLTIKESEGHRIGSMTATLFVPALLFINQNGLYYMKSGLGF